jgi:hypothetical protein
MVLQTKSPKGIIAVGIFLFFAAMMASLAGTTLVWRDNILDRVWAINAPAYARLAPLGKTVGIPFLLLGATLAVAGAGWFKRRLWRWRLAVAIIATQVLGDMVNAFMGHLVRGGVGFVIAGGSARLSSASRGQSGLYQCQRAKSSLTNSNRWKVMRF